MSKYADIWNMEPGNVESKSKTTETKALILKSALKLFNERGVHSVTTHDIAHDASISPGNLYYHYKNKQAIVRDLFYQIEIFSINEWWKKSPAGREVRFSDFMQFYFGALSKHRFFFRDFSSLINEDKVLEKRWSDMYKRLFAVMQETLKGWIDHGLIKPFANQADANIFIETIWIISAFSQVHIEARRSFSDEALLAERAKYLAKFLYPYHTPKGQRAIELYL